MRSIELRLVMRSLMLRLVVRSLLLRLVVRSLMLRLVWILLLASTLIQLGLYGVLDSYRLGKAAGFC